MKAGANKTRDFFFCSFRIFPRSVQQDACFFYDETPEDLCYRKFCVFFLEPFT